MEDLACHVEFVVAKTPGASGAELINNFIDYSRYPDSFDGNYLAPKASFNVYGSAGDNCKYLPVLKDKLESDRHQMEFTAIKGENERFNAGSGQG